MREAMRKDYIYLALPRDSGNPLEYTATKRRKRAPERLSKILKKHWELDFTPREDGFLERPGFPFLFYPLLWARTNLGNLLLPYEGFQDFLTAIYKKAASLTERPFIIWMRSDALKLSYFAVPYSWFFRLEKNPFPFMVYFQGEIPPLVILWTSKFFEIPLREFLRPNGCSLCLSREVGEQNVKPGNKAKEVSQG